jgi:digalactosyldiacylglycerol synthase
MTGTSINPLLRAAHLSDKGFPVCLVMPWLLPEQQPKLFPAGLTFDTPAEQAEWIQEWLGRAGLEVAARRLTVRWYPAIYEEFLGAIIQRSGVDVARIVPRHERDVAVRPPHRSNPHPERELRGHTTAASTQSLARRLLV